MVILKRVRQYVTEATFLTYVLQYLTMPHLVHTVGSENISQKSRESSSGGLENSQAQLHYVNYWWNEILRLERSKGRKVHERNYQRSQEIR